MSIDNMLENMIVALRKIEFENYKSERQYNYGKDILNEICNILEKLSRDIVDVGLEYRKYKVREVFKLFYFYLLEKDVNIFLDKFSNQTSTNEITIIKILDDIKKENIGEKEKEIIENLRDRILKRKYAEDRLF